MRLAPEQSEDGFRILLPLYRESHRQRLWLSLYRARKQEKPCGKAQRENRKQERICDLPPSKARMGSESSCPCIEKATGAACGFLGAEGCRISVEK